MNNHTVTLELQDSIGLICIDNPPVNVLSEAVVAGLEAAVAECESNSAIRAILIWCRGSTFVAGGDISWIESPAFSTLSSERLNAVLARIEAMDKPVVAALHGVALGGGLELAMACHFRIAARGTKIGFPEVSIGLLPGALGTQRAPRLGGTALALELMLSGQSIGADRALSAGLVDELFDGDARESGLAFIQSVLDRPTDALPRASKRAPAQIETSLLQSAYAKARAVEDRYPAQLAIVSAVEAACGPFDVGAALEAEAFERLRLSPQSRALRHLFFAQRECGKIPGLPSGLNLRPIQRVGVLGAGTMGRGIAMNFLNAGIATVLVDTQEEALSKAQQAIRETYEANVAKGRLAQKDLDARMGLLSTAVSDTVFSDCDLVIEAVFENMELKKQVCTRLGELCKPGAIIATNTSTLDVDVLAAATGRPGDVVGLHFFSPANIMKLLEVVRGAKTDPVVLATVMRLARTIGKIGVVSGVCYGFIGNRMGEVYMRETEFLLMEGAQPEDLDAAMEQFGMAMGPCRMLDMAGIDVGAKTVIEYEKVGGLPPDPTYRALVRKLFAMGRHGQKTRLGYYRYEGRKAAPDPELSVISRGLAVELGIEKKPPVSAAEIVERLLFPMINEAAKILGENIAYRGSDIDVVWAAGYGFPDFRGGPLCYADEVGLQTVVDRMNHFGRTRGNEFGYWSVAPLLEELAKGGQRISNWKEFK